MASSYAAIYLQLGSVASSDVLISLGADLPWMSHSVVYFANDTASSYSEKVTLLLGFICCMQGMQPAQFQGPPPFSGGECDVAGCALQGGHRPFLLARFHLIMCNRLRLIDPACLEKKSH